LTGDNLYTDKQLFILIAEGDEHAFGILFHRYIPKIQPVIFGLTASEAITKDLIQDIFLNLWVGRDKLADIDSPADWIFRITYNKTYNWLEQHKNRQRIRLQLAGAAETESRGNPVEESVQLAETSRLVKEAIKALPPQTQRIYRLSREQGLNNQQIAKELELSPHTVRNTLTNAARSIRAYLAENGVVLPLSLILFMLT
jgi:RNA polymerase sigma-70 factor (family 1)